MNIWSKLVAFVLRNGKRTICGGANQCFGATKKQKWLAASAHGSRWQNTFRFDFLLSFWNRKERRCRGAAFLFLRRGRVGWGGGGRGRGRGRGRRSINVFNVRGRWWLTISHAGQLSITSDTLRLFADCGRLHRRSGPKQWNPKHPETINS